MYIYKILSLEGNLIIRVLINFSSMNLNKEEYVFNIFLLYLNKNRFVLK